MCVYCSCPLNCLLSRYAVAYTNGGQNILDVMVDDCEREMEATKKGEG